MAISISCKHKIKINTKISIKTYHIKLHKIVTLQAIGEFNENVFPQVYTFSINVSMLYTILANI